MSMYYAIHNGTRFNRIQCKLVLSRIKDAKKYWAGFYKPEISMNTIYNVVIELPLALPMKHQCNRTHSVP